MQIITEFTRSTYRDINRSLLAGVNTQQAIQLIDAVSGLPTLPGTTYRTFWVDDIAGYTEQLKTSKLITFRAFTSTSRSKGVAEQFNGNVRLTIEGKTGRDIAAWSDNLAEEETLYLPELTCRIKKVRTIKIGGKVWAVEAELVEL
ncbi:hypothetical protein GCM10023189_31450 [Nibrella saemangeumensis]|uniref:ADP ribosyltransferase domain-containing protein n=1 Tax=Nibrella saemangeumensis TaxID=1084526 RepID=A0ABP8MZM5_9BACT